MAVIVVLAFLSAAGIAYGGSVSLVAGRWHVLARVDRHAVRPWRADPVAEGLAARQAVRARPRAAAVARSRRAGPLMAGVQRLIDQSGVPLRPGEFAGLTAACGVLGALLLWAIARNAPGVLIGAAAALLPWALVARARAQRQSAIERRLPDLLMSLAGALRAGHGLLAALQSASDERDTPLSKPIQQLLAEVGLGAPLEEALERLAQTVGNPDVDLLVTAIVIHRRVGGNLGEILERIGHTTRERIRLRLNLRTLTAQGRLSAIIISLLPVVVTAILSLISPQMFRTLIFDPLGRLVLFGAALLEIVGILLVRRIVHIRF